MNGCGVIDAMVYKLNIQQGNITEERHVDKLEIGMTKEQVKFVLGSPMSVDAFDQDRWDYIYTNRVRNEGATRSNLTIYFENHKLTRMDGKPSQKSPKPEDEKDEKEENADEDNQQLEFGNSKEEDGEEEENNP